jgi:hypothetical protein
MAYRNGTYVGIDGNVTTNLTDGDIKYYEFFTKIERYK